MSLAKWGRRHDYFASDLGSGVPISRGSHIAGIPISLLHRYSKLSTGAGSVDTALIL